MTWTNKEFGATLNALRDQGFRRVILEAIDPDVRFTTGDSQIDSAFVRSKSEPAWGEVARQLNQFSQRAGFQAVCVRRDKHDLEVACLVAYDSGPLTLDVAQERSAHTQVIMDGLNGIVRTFSFADETRELLASVLEVDGAGGGGQPAVGNAPTEAPPKSPLENDPKLDPGPRAFTWPTASANTVAPAQSQPAPTAPTPPQADNQDVLKKLAISSLLLIWDFLTSTTVQDTFIPIGGSGLAPDTIQTLEAGRFSWSTYTAGLDCPNKKIHGHTAYYSLKLDHFNTSYKGYMS